MSASGEKRDRQFGMIVEMAIRYGKPVRIGANWGSLDQELLTHLMDENAKTAKPLDARAITREAMVQSALLSAARAEEIGLGRDRIILSAKVSAVQDLIAVYRELARRSDYALHLGLTEAGMGSKGIVASAAAIGALLQDGIGDTIRFSLTPEPGGDRTLEVKAAQELLQTMGFRTFVPLVAACPGCGRTTSTVFQELARDIQNWITTSMPEWRKTPSGRRAAQRRGDGLHRQRPRRIEARRYRHLAARHRRDAGRPGLHRRQEGHDVARRWHRGRVPHHRPGLYRAPLRCDRPQRRGVKLSRQRLGLITALGVTQVVSWGSLYYAIGILGPIMVAEGHLSTDLVYGGYSLSLLISGLAAPLTGRAIDRLGGGRVMALGSVLAAVALALMAASRGAPLFITASVVAGVAISMTLYEAAFASLVGLTRRRAADAIAALTLIGGFASTVFWPLTEALQRVLDWRETYFVYAAAHLLVCLPLHAVRPATDR